MAIFLGAKGGDMLTWRSVSELVNGLQGVIAERMQILQADEQTALLGKVKAALNEALAEEERFADEFARLFKELEQAQYEDELPPLHGRFNRLSVDYFRKRGSVLALNALATAFRDELTRKVLSLAERFTDPDRSSPRQGSYCWLTGDAGGREEQTLRGNPDYFLVYRNEGRDSASYFERFSYRVMATLEGCGLLGSAARLVSAKRLWRGSADEWLRLLDEELGRDGDARLDILSRLADLRPLHPGEGLGMTVRSLAEERLRLDPASELMRQWARKGVGMPVALGLFGGFKVERSGTHRGCFNLEQLALMPLVLNVKLLAVGFGVRATGTASRIRGLQAEGRISVDMAERLLLAYHEFARHKVRLELDNEREDAMFLNPDGLPESEREKLRSSMELVVNLQKIVYQTFLEYV